MTVYVDQLMNHGWSLRGHRVSSCHMFTDDPTLQELEAVARYIGMKPQWLQLHSVVPHYDLTPARRAAALRAGAKPLTRDGFAVEYPRIKRLFKEARAVNTNEKGALV